MSTKKGNAEPLEATAKAAQATAAAEKAATTPVKKTEDFNLKRNTGFLHISQEKTKEDSPDFFGSMDVNGVRFALGGWSKQGKESGTTYMALNFDLDELSTEARTEARKEILKDYLADKEKEENKNLFLLMEQTGTLHLQSDLSKKEDCFGSVLLNGEKVYIVGFMTGTKEKPVIRLKVSEGLKSKEERSEMAKGFVPSGVVKG